MDADDLLEEPAVDRHPVHHVGHAKAGARQQARLVGVPEDLLSQADAVLPGFLGLMPMDEFGEIQLEFD